MKVSVVVCTRNRSESLARLLSCNALKAAVIEHVVVVDSSSQSSEIEGNLRALASIKKASLVRSEPGLPGQRNAGASYLLRALGVEAHSIVCFLDDDVTVPDEYFERVLEVFGDEDAIIGAWDESLPPTPTNFPMQLLSQWGVVSLKPYSISRAAATTAGRVEEYKREVDWVPGHSFSMRLQRWSDFKFNQKITMTGEDLEYQLRSMPVKLFLSSRLRVIHHRELRERRSQFRSSYEEAVFRYFLAKRYPEKFSAISATMFNLITCLVSLSKPTRFYTFLGVTKATLEFMLVPAVLRRSIDKLGFDIRLG